MFRNYIKIAWRNLIKRKVFTVINILGLAIGFGSAILIYLFLNFHLSYDKFHENSDRIVRVNTELHRDEIAYRLSVPPGFAKVFREDYDYAEKVAKIVDRSGLILEVADGSTMNKFKQDVAYVEEDFFKIFNFPLLNNSNNISIASPNTAVVTENAAMVLFGSTSIVGQTFVLENDKSIEVTGVLKNLPAASFLDTEVFISFENLEDNFEFAASETWGGITSNLQTFALIRPNQNISEIEEVLTELPKKHRPNSTNVHVYKLQPMNDVHFNPDYGGLNPVFLVVFGIIGLFLIVIACINFINISTAQAFYRSKEIGIRKVLGSYKQHLFWQFLCETFLISLFALIIGIGLANLFLPSMNNLFELQLTITDLLSFQFLGFMLILLAVVAFLSGSYPGILMSRIVPVLALKGKLSHSANGSASIRKVLVSAQFVISIMLIVASIIISKQIDFAINTDLGFDKESIVMLDFPTEINATQLQSMKDRLEQIPGVENSTACLASPGGSENDWSTGVKYGNRAESEEFNIQVKAADVDYLSTFDIPLVAGRNIFKSDTLTEVLVNERLGVKLGLNSPEEMLGEKLTANGGDIQATIVGVVADFHNNSFTEDISPILIGEYLNWYGEIGVKISHLNTRNTIHDIEKVWSQTFSNNIFDYRFLDERVAEQYDTEQQYLTLSKTFSALAILIGCLGLYGLILFFVGQRTKEIGIRKVLGSNVNGILKMFSIDFLKLILISGIIATPITWYFMDQWLQGYTYRTDIQWWYFVVAIVAVISVTFITISYQTIKVASISPVKSLRSE